jgi:hypothetical protein
MAEIASEAKVAEEAYAALERLWKWASSQKRKKPHASKRGIVAVATSASFHPIETDTTMAVIKVVHIMSKVPSVAPLSPAT